MRFFHELRLCPVVASKRSKRSRSWMCHDSRRLWMFYQVQLDTCRLFLGGGMTKVGCIRFSVHAHRDHCSLALFHFLAHPLLSRVFGFSDCCVGPGWVRISRRGLAGGAPRSARSGGPARLKVDLWIMRYVPVTHLLVVPRTMVELGRAVGGGTIVRSCTCAVVAKC